MMSPTDARRRRGDATRARLLAAARTLLAEVGQDVSLDAIAARVGVTKQAALHHFASKERLIVELVVEGLEAERDAALAAVAGHAGPSALTAYARGLAAFYTTDLERFRTVYLRGQVVPVGPDVLPPAERARRVVPVTTAMYDAVEAAVRRGPERPPPDLRALVVALHFAALGLATADGATRAAGGGFKQALDTYLDALLGVVERGLARAAGP